MLPSRQNGEKENIMAIVKLELAIAELNKYFEAINKEFYSNQLPQPIITIQHTPRAYGHCTRQKVWKYGKVNKYEINIGADTLARKREEIATTMIHESVHLYCRENGIKEVSGAYHNQTFKALAESKTLEITCHEKYGYTISNPTKATKDFCKKYGLKKILLNRGELIDIKTKGDKKEKAKTSTRKYICPACGNSVRATKDLNIMCMDCKRQMIKTD